MLQPKILPVFARLTVAAVFLAGLVLVVASASAQSAEDVATARRSAVEGIRLFQKNEYAAALERLERAQALYDVPVHRLYIARAQVKLGNWVEATETYRKLARVVLSADAPAEFRSAIDTGNTELAALEPQLPTLRVIVKPATLKGLAITIDEREFPSAAIGIERPTNPGEHVIVVRADGATPQRRTVSVRESAKEDVVFHFAVSAEAPAKLILSAKPPAGDAARSKSAGKGAEKRSFHLEYMLGLRLGLSAPVGSIGAGVVKQGKGGNPPPRELDIRDLVGDGGGLELRGGVRFHRRLAAVVYFEAHGLREGRKSTDTSAYTLGPLNPRVSLSSSASATSFGLGVVLGTDPREFGGFGEFDLALLRSLSVEQSFTSDFCRGKNNTASFSGPGIRLGGGLNIPTKIMGTLTPMLMATWGQFRSYEAGSTCVFVGRSEFPLIDPTKPGTTKYAISDKRTHGMIFLGLGGEFFFGGN